MIIEASQGIIKPSRKTEESFMKKLKLISDKTKTLLVDSIVNQQLKGCDCNPVGKNRFIVGRSSALLWGSRAEQAET